MYPPSPSPGRWPGLRERLEEAARRMNAFLVMVALGLAIVLLTSFWALTIEKDLASARQATAPIAPAEATGPSRN
jgi:hypothetical protein